MAIRPYAQTQRLEMLMHPIPSTEVSYSHRS